MVATASGLQLGATAEAAGVEATGATDESHSQSLEPTVFNLLRARCAHDASARNPSGKGSPVTFAHHQRRRGSDGRTTTHVWLSGSAVVEVCEQICVGGDTTSGSVGGDRRRCCITHRPSRHLSKKAGVASGEYCEIPLQATGLPHSSDNDESDKYSCNSRQAAG